MHLSRRTSLDSKINYPVFHSFQSLDGHQCTITGVTFNHYHIVSSSTDCYALAWSTIGRHTKCLQAFRHPKAVHCVKLMYCRVITGAADGKVVYMTLAKFSCQFTTRLLKFLI